jgi:hypothetical protein
LQIDYEINQRARVIVGEVDHEINQSDEIKYDLMCKCNYSPIFLENKLCTQAMLLDAAFPHCFSKIKYS